MLDGFDQDAFASEVEFVQHSIFFRNDEFGVEHLRQPSKITPLILRDLFMNICKVGQLCFVDGDEEVFDGNIILNYRRKEPML